MSFDADGFVGALPWTALAIFGVLVITYIGGRIAGRHSVVDVAWGLLFIAAALTAYLLSAGSGDGLRRALLLGTVTIWGLRLAIHIGVRSRGKGEDPRYAAMLRDKGLLATILMVYGLQGLLAWVISMPVIVGMYAGGGWWPVVWLGVAIWAFGLAFEAIGDAQLERYKANPERPRVLDTGLWRYTRHPNYFGDACVWVGIFLISASAWPGVLTVLSPAIMVYLLAFGSGKKVLERSMAKRPGYQDYMRRTSGFFPLPPSRRSSSTEAPSRWSSSEER
ncbi:DUF1295 domain-containing protein [Epidermidibacterium keratini]|uniref:DUF1295 domain-containing protein n=1 Tax=Epidermidibacterium keratini TaxID=1891644 RepID=A0A7L4YP91_9ACTN|nr:DUF1295 domain-containing protein [Epidermidibacterium keratini]QHC00377.1 DUF1295 domain-containing protein [Epidermidibacterium keratini]